MSVEDGKEEEIDVVVEEEAQQDDAVVEGQEPEPKEQDDDPAAGIAALKAQIAAFEEREKQRQVELESTRKTAQEARVAREEAERRAERARSEAAATERQARENAYSSVVNALSAAESALAQQENAAQQAAIDGDWAKHAKLSAEIGKTAARIEQLSAGKAEMEADGRRSDGGRTERVPNDQPSEAEQQETFIRRLPPRSAAWVRDHKDRYFNDASFQNMVAGAHQLAVGRGIQQESDAYFKFIEEQCGLRQSEPETRVESHQETPAAPAPTPRSPTSTAAASQPRRSPTPAAPAATGAPTSARSSGSPSVSVQLTPEEREFCRTNEIAEENYARQKKQLMDEKRLGPQAIH